MESPRRRRAGRRQALGWAFVLYLGLAALMLLPLASPRLIESSSADFYSHVSGVVEARSALLEGQFPIRTCTIQGGGERYPYFQYYGNFPYTVAGLLSLVPGINPYTAFKLAMLLFLAGGGFYLFRCGLELTRRTFPSVVAGAVFITAPYMWTDVHARFAFTEIAAICLMPAALFYSLRAYRAPGPRSIVFAGVCWCLMLLSHSVAFLYAGSFVGLFFASYLWPRWSRIRRLGRVGAGFALGVGLAMWFVVPQLFTLNQLNIGQGQDHYSPFTSRALTSLELVLWPWRTMAEGGMSSNHLFGAQAGWLILAGVLLAAAALPVLWLRRRRRTAIPLSVIPRLLLLFAAALLMTVAPFDVWAYLPKPYRYIQFTYRMLMFVTLFGSLLAACGIAAWLRREPGTIGYALTLLLVGLVSASYPPYHPNLSAGALPGLIARPDTGRAGGNSLYIVRDEALRRASLVDADTGAPPAGVALVPRDEARADVTPGRHLRFRSSLAQESIVQLPVFYHPHLWHVTDHGEPIPYGSVGHYLAVRLPPGARRVRATFVGIPWANVGSVVALGIGIVGIVWPGVRNTVKRRGERRRNRHRRRAVPSIGAREVIACLGAAGVGLAIAPVQRIGKLVEFPIELRAAASRESVPGGDPAYAVDGDPGTVWAASGTEPVTFTIDAERPGRLSGIELRGRQSALYETWQTVAVRVFYRGQVVAEREASFPDAGRHPDQRVDLSPVLADRVELSFRDPVREYPDGRPLDAGTTINPGYREIRLVWVP